MLREHLPPHKTATYVLPRYKAVYVSVPKAACTSLKWLIAELQEEDPERFYRSISREVGRPMTIHRRQRWRNTPMLTELPDAELAAISPENGWFVFAVVRHPAARLWAAWQSKFLLRDPRWMTEFADAPWLPRLPATTADVADDFAGFVASLAQDPEQRVMRDRHFMSQRALLTPRSTPYTRIYDTAEIPQLLEDLDAHLRTHGWDGRLELRRSNESPLAPLRTMFTPAVTGAIAELYRDDLETFGYSDLLPPAADPATEYPRAMLVTIGLLAERSERLGDLALRTQALTESARELRERNAGLRNQNRALRAQIRSLRSAPQGLRSIVRRAYRKVTARR